MNGEWKAKWVTALRDGSYEQGREKLRTSDDKYCCLGVLVDLVDPDGWEFDNQHGWRTRSGHKSYLPEKIRNEVGVTENNPVVDVDGHGVTTLGTLNDVSHYTFEQIADIVEQQL